MDFRWDIVMEYLPFFLEGAVYTIVWSLAATLMGTLLGLLIGLGKMSKRKLIAVPFKLYINLFRGTPMFVQLCIIHFGVMPLLGPPPTWVSLVVTLGLNSAAYIAEIFRAGIQSVERGQTEAARSLGMSNSQAMRFIILPQAFKRMIPPLGNEFIVLLKESSLGSIIAAPELMYWGRAAVGEYYKVWEPYLTVALIYLILTLTLTFFVNKLEKRYENA